MSGVERAHRRDETGVLGARRSHLRDGAHDPHGARRLRERDVHRLELRRLVVDRAHVRVDGVPVAAGDRPREVEAVLDRARHQGHERLGRRACGLEQAARRAVQRHEVVRRDGRARVVERASVVVEVERAQAERQRKLAAVRARLVALAADGRPGAVELLGPARARERLQRVHPEPARVRLERGERRRAADVGDPLAMSQGQSLGRGRDRRVRNAQQDELCVVAKLDAALLEARRDGRTDAAATDDVD